MAASSNQVVQSGMYFNSREAYENNSPSASDKC